MYQKTKCYSFFIFLIIPHNFEAAPGCTQPVAKVVSVQGKVDKQYSGSSEWQIVQADDKFCPGDKIRTEKRSRATLILSNESLVTLDQSTTLIFSEPEEVKDPAVGTGLGRLPLPAAERPLGPIALRDPVRCQERVGAGQAVLGTAVHRATADVESADGWDPLIGVSEALVEP